MTNNSGVSFLQKLKKTALTLTAIGITIGASPLAIEGGTNAYNDHALSSALDKIATEKSHLCAPPSAQTLASAQQVRLSELTRNAYADQRANWSDPKAVYQSGLKHVVSYLQLSSLETVPEDLKVENYITDISITEEDVQTLAKMGVSVCFDEKLDGLKMGSAYTPELGVITLSPNMSDAQTTIHFRRQLDRLKGAVANPYRNFIESAGQKSADFNRFSKIQTWLETITKGDVTGLKAEGDPNISDFITLKAAPNKDATQYRATVYTAPKA